MLILGIESSCDETAAAVYDTAGELRSNVVFSQVDLHARFGGIVPELASRAHIEKIVPVVDEALARAKVGLAELDAIAVTQGPGLVGSLLVGVSYAKTLAYAAGIPLIGVNHIEAHLHSPLLELDDLTYPFLALLVSGGHTMLWVVRDVGDYRFLGQTRDDAAGEAFDKVAKMMGLGYPGGAVIDRLAKEGDATEVRFPRAQVDGFDLSFSGLKTAVRRFVESDDAASVREPDLAASFQEAVIDQLVAKTVDAARSERLRTIVAGGGVAANSRLRTKLTEAAGEVGATCRFPSLALCTDNAAMIAWLGARRLERGERAGPELNADPNLLIPA